MDFQYTPEQEQFRADLHSWLEVNLPSELCVEDAMDERVAPDWETFDKRRAWQRKMYEGGWVGIPWPTEYGGRGAGLMEQVVFDEEYTRARAPVLPGFSGIALCGPTLMQWGTAAQKEEIPTAHTARQRYLVSGLLRARCRLRLGQLANASRGRWRRVCGEWPESLDLGRAVRGLDFYARSH